MKVLWVGDAVGTTGFERCTRAACAALHAAGHEVHVLGINFFGDPHDFPYKIYPAQRKFDSCPMGTSRVADMVATLRPHAVVLLNDPWNVPRYMTEIRKVDERVPVVCWLAVDGKNQRGSALNDFRFDCGDGIRKHRGPALCVFWTRFGEEELRLGGYAGASAIVQLGVDLDIYQRRDRIEARKRFGAAEEHLEAFWVGVVGRNQPRKRLDLALSFFAEWIKTHEVPRARLFAHIAPTGEDAWRLRQLADYYGLHGRLLLSEPPFGRGVEEREFAWIYSAMDVLISPGQGEGWWLPGAEAAACGVPCIATGWAAVAEWMRDVAVLVPVREIAHTMNGINAQGGIPGRKEFIAALDQMYRDRELRRQCSRRGLELVAQSRFRWEVIGAEMVAAIEATVESERLRFEEDDRAREIVAAAEAREGAEREVVAARARVAALDAVGDQLEGAA